jgi:hypothetical protein
MKDEASTGATQDLASDNVRERLTLVKDETFLKIPFAIFAVFVSLSFSSH